MSRFLISPSVDFRGSLTYRLVIGKVDPYSGGQESLYKAKKFITAFVSPLPLRPSPPRKFSPHPASQTLLTFILSLHFLQSPKSHISWSFATKILHKILTSQLCPTCPVLRQNMFNPLKTKSICFIYGLSAYRAVNTLHSIIKTSLLMFYKAKVAVCSEIRTKHINAMWEPRRIFNVKPGGM
jgi:hypothetical protein